MRRSRARARLVAEFLLGVWSLGDFLGSNDPMSLKLRFNLAIDGACGMRYLHEQVGVIQRDLKSDNVRTCARPHSSAPSLTAAAPILATPQR